MRFEKKEWIPLLIAMLLSCAGFATADRLVFIPCFSISWILAIWLCIEHEGRRILRGLAACVVTVFFIFIAWRANESAQRNQLKTNRESERAEMQTPTPLPRLTDLANKVESGLKEIGENLSKAQKALTLPPSPTPLPSSSSNTLTPHEIVGDVKRAYPAFREETAKEYKGADVDWNLLFESASISSQPKLKDALEVLFEEQEPYNEDLIICYVPLKGHEYLRLLRRGGAFRVRGKIAGVNGLNQLVIAGSSIEKLDLPKPTQPSLTPNTEASPH